MKFSCTHENLYQALTLVSRVTARAGNLPILNHVYIKATEEGIVFKATNLEIGVTCKTRGKTETMGEFTVPARLFTDYIASLPKEKIDCELNGEVLTVKCGRHRTSIKGTSAAEFPLIPEIEQGTEYSIAPEELSRGLEQVLFAISPTETRPEISGALFWIDKNRLTVVGTDSYRLAEKKIKSEASGSSVKAIVPLRSLQELNRICGQISTPEGKVRLILGQNQIALVSPTVEFVSRLIEGDYPDYRAIVPAEFSTQVIISRAELIAAIKAAGLFSKAGVYDVALEISDKGTVKIEGLSSQTGEHTSTLDAEIKGAPVKIAFNWKYFLEGINALRSERVVISAGDSSSPALIKEEQEDDYFYLLMPIKE